ncbi:ABC transporter substrate-binding protein [Rhodovastum atsumiense]|uniref:ABC transporter substrate-binding protein n=1 Tax=Rhodovastum atsumiense TaxID=504468 RepID=A0A5M6INY0_9PROT|nr:ABC transporter substrate-binding protein [Rhodovastum atsumiense]KAA5609268.1 ABC transporter substrate-binding protein [Rhodovastum atsumiense]CAH2601724.1 ABC transporter substrate-binding protein [Rhodovastum atsumiense]
MMILRRIARATLFAAALLLAASPARAREVVDMSGRTITLPADIHRVYGAFSSAVAIMAAIAPDLLAGSYFDTTPDLARFLPPGFAALPRLSVSGIQTTNPEQLMAAGIDLGVVLDGTGLSEQVRATMARLGRPAVAVAAERLEQYPATFRFLGAVLQRPERGEALARYLEETGARVAAALRDLPDGQRPRVYYAESPDGLQSQCDGSARAEVIGLAGGRNVLHCAAANSFAATATMTAETVLLLDPDVILVRFPRTATMFLTEPRWQTLAAVRSRRVLVVPSLPFNWMDRPPSYMRIMGVQWLAGRLHPDRYRIDLPAETRAFFRLFFGVALTDADLHLLFAGTAAP